MPTERKKSSGIKRTFKPTLMIKRIGLIVFAVYVCFTVVEQQKKINENNTLMQEYTKKISDANADNSDLKTQLAQIDSPQYLERVAREKLKLAKPGDRIFIDSGKVK